MSMVPALLTARLQDRSVKPLSTGEFWKLIALVGAADRLTGAAAAAIGALTGFPLGECERIEALLQRADELAEASERWESAGISLLNCDGESYPQRLIDRLGDGAPPILYAAGEVSLFDDDGLGVVGSRNVSREAMDVAEAAGRAAVARGVPVVSGAARGIDQTAMGGAIRAGGCVVGLPADSMEKVLKTGEVREALEEDRLCLATPVTPSAPFSVGAAMGRNKLIYAFSQVTLVVTSDSGTGGTWAGATEALKKRIGPVAAWSGPGAGEGNAKLVRMGAAEVTAIDEVWEFARQDRSTRDDEQLRMIF